MTEETSASNDPNRSTEEEERKQFQRIGAQLRQRREALSLEQGDVARQLHLPGMVVNDMETGRIESLSGLYRRGYIRNYARLLELDPDGLLAQAGEEMPPELKEVLPVPKHTWQLERYLKIATYVLVTIAIIPPLVYFFVAGGSRMLERDPVSEDTPRVAQPDTDVQPPPEHESAAGGHDERGDDGTDRRHVSASALPMNPIRPLRETEPEAIESPTDGSESETAVAVSALQLELLEDSWVEVHDAEGTRLEYDLLRSGQTRSYEGQAPFRLLVGRSSAVELQVNGQSVEWAGHESGDVAEIAVAADGQIER